MTLQATTRLSRAPGLQMDIDGAGLIQLRVNGVLLRPGPATLAVLAASGDDSTVSEIVQRATAVSPGWKPQEIVDAVITLHSVGVLLEPDNVAFSPLPLASGGYDSVFVHLKMLNDIERKRAFMAGIRGSVSPGDTVLDIGSGSGILALEAARAGAATVYALEPSAIGGTVQETAKRSGIKDGVIHPIRGWLSGVDDLPPIDVASCDLVGNDPLDMSLWEIFTDARQRLLRPGAATMPMGVTLNATLTRVPRDIARQHRVDQEHVDSWNSALGFDFSVMQERQPAGCSLIHERPETVTDFEALSCSTKVGTVDFSEAAHPVTFTTSLTASRPCVVNAIVIHATIHLAPGVDFSTSPWTGSSRSHWFTPVWLLEKEIQLSEGGSLPVTYNYLGAGVSALTTGDANQGVDSAPEAEEGVAA